MISVLIPVYNYTIVALVKTLHQQLSSAMIPFEIIVMDDNSSSNYNTKNSEIDTLTFTYFNRSTTNRGRALTRQDLCDKAKYEWLLFLDADVMPRHSDFIQNYLSLMPTIFDVVYGGFFYKNTVPNSEFLLRWKYGLGKEVKEAKLRNKTPYKIVISANFMVRKTVFKRINSNINGNRYGYDNYFGALLKAHKIKVFHIDNEVQHLGIDTSDVFLIKQEEAANLLLDLYKENNIKVHDNELLNLFIQLKKYHLHHLLSSFYATHQSQMRRNLLSKNPSIPLLQLYRISYMCHTSKNNQML